MAVLWGRLLDWCIRQLYVPERRSSGRDRIAGLLRRNIGDRSQSRIVLWRRLLVLQDWRSRQLDIPERNPSGRGQRGEHWL